MKWTQTQRVYMSNFVGHILISATIWWWKSTVLCTV